MLSFSTKYATAAVYLELSSQPVATNTFSSNRKIYRARKKAYTNYHLLKKKKMLIDYQPLESEMSAKLSKIFGKENVFIRVQPGDVVMPRKYSEIGESILNLKVRPDDTWLVSYPRTGEFYAKRHFF